MSEARKRRRRITEKRARKIALLVFLLVGSMVGGGYVYAKYYSQSVQNGIAIASGVYFTANYAVTSTNEEDYFESIVKSGYQGTDTDFVFEVRNYENNMLFNEGSVEIPYSVYFWLESAPTDNTVYSVRFGEEQKILSVGAANKVGFEMHKIQGGRATANKYTVLVDVPEGVKHTSIPIYALVETEAGAVISTTLRGKMIFSTMSRAESYIESQAFVVSGNVATDEEKFAELQKLSELTYEIKTVGEVTGGDDSTEKLKLSWNPTVLEINMFDDAYMVWKRETGNAAPLEDEEGWYYITVNVMPYSAETVGFFRGSQYMEKIVNSANSMEALKEAILAEKYQEGNEGS